jgi:enoyl-CoA hydratase/carnithine racemase
MVMAAKEVAVEQFKGQALSWQVNSGVIELALFRTPCNELGSLSLAELEQFASALDQLKKTARALIIYSELNSGFCAGADLRELYQRSQSMQAAEAVRQVRDFLERIHAVLNRIDASPLTTIAAVHGVTFGGGLELALACDLIIADKTARFAFPELRLGLAQQIGLVSQVVSEGEALRAARATATQLGKFDRHTAAAAKQFIKPIPDEELRREIDLFCELFSRPAVQAGLKKFVESTAAQPYLP